jgi:valyl-tRNA synthetase
MSEAIYHQFSLGKTGSVHRENWPEPHETVDDTSIRDGKLLLDLIADARREKSSKGLSLGSNIKKIVITTGAEHLHLLKENEETILRTLKANSMDLERSPSSSNPLKEPSLEFKVEILA